MHTFSKATIALAALALGGRTLPAQAPLGPATSDSPISLERGAGFLTVDLTKAHDKTAPVIRFGYQSLLGDATRARGNADRESDVHNVPYYSVSLTGIPSGDVANLFSAGALSTGADLQLSFGQAYLLSYVTARDVRAVAASIAALSTNADEIERIRRASSAAQLREPVNRAVVGALQDSVAQRVRSVTTRRTALATRLAETQQASVRAQFEIAIDYADRILAYATSNTADKPAALDPLAAFGQRDGPIYDAWFARVGVNAGSATFFDAAQPFSQQFRSRSYQGYSAQLGYSVRFGGALPFILAASGGVIRSSNVDELGSVTVTETQTFTSADGSTQRGTSRKRVGLVGDFVEETKALGKFDAVIYPGLAAASREGKPPRSTIALDLFGRATRTLPFVYGVGAYLTKPGSPTSVYGGVNAYRATDRKLAIDLVVGFPF